MIYEPKSVFISPKLVKIAEEVLPGISSEKVSQLVANSFTNEDSKLLVFEKEGEPQAFVVATIEMFELQPAVFVQVCACRPIKNETWVTLEMFARLRKWARSRDINSIYTIVVRSPRPFMRKFKFKFYGTILKREVGDEDIR